jgi:hypothetical protein
VRVLDFTSVMAGPFASRMLADLGAEVVKIESLEGDQVRARPPLRDGHSAYFGHLNAGKQSLACNLKAPRSASSSSRWCPASTSSSRISAPASWPASGWIMPRWRRSIPG